MVSEVLITKSDGTQEVFDPNKLIHSLVRAGVEERLIGGVVDTVTAHLTTGMHTGDIYRYAFSLLKKKAPKGSAARYALKRALFEFGPSGFPFEAYLAELFRKDGYKATTNLLGKGKCTEHEIDVLLEKDGVRTYIEAKFHNTPGFKTDLKVVLYVTARMEDIAAVEGDTVRSMVVTNTKFTSRAIEYSTCSGLELLGWDYPFGNNLYTRIEKSGLYPITALATLTAKEKQALISQKIVLCNAVPRSTETLKAMGIKEGRMKSLFEEVGALCGH